MGKGYLTKTTSLAVADAIEGVDVDVQMLGAITNGCCQERPGRYMLLT